MKDVRPGHHGHGLAAEELLTGTERVISIEVYPSIQVTDNILAGINQTVIIQISPEGRARRGHGNRRQIADARVERPIEHDAIFVVDGRGSEANVSTRVKGGYVRQRVLDGRGNGPAHRVIVVPRLEGDWRVRAGNGIVAVKLECDVTDAVSNTERLSLRGGLVVPTDTAGKQDGQ